MVPGSVAMEVLCISDAAADYEAHGKVDGSKAEVEEECGPEELTPPLHQCYHAMMLQNFTEISFVGPKIPKRVSAWACCHNWLAPSRGAIFSVTCHSCPPCL